MTQFRTLTNKNIRCSFMNFNVFYFCHGMTQMQLLLVQFAKIKPPNCKRSHETSLLTMTEFVLF